MRILVSCLAIAVLTSCATWRYCADPPGRKSPDGEIASLTPGHFTIEFQATGGTSRGHRVTGDLTLAPVDPTIRPDGYPLYGWLNADLDEVDAPLCLNYEPLPTSKDPLLPGVLVDIERDGSQVLTIANAGNKYQPGRISVDGCGIILFVDQADSTGFSGRWGPYGIVINGCGYYYATRRADSA